jgi:hypothetical protein
LPVKIEWPQNLLAVDSVVERWFIDAVAKNLIEPRYFKAKTAEEMAKALENAGIIKLARSTKEVIPQTEGKQNEI